MTIEIIIDGTKKIVTGQQLFDLAAQGEIGPETPVYVDGKKVPAGQAKGIIFGQRRNNAQTTSRDIPASHTTSADTNDQPSEGKEELPSDLRFILQAVGLGLIPLLALACFQVAGVVMPWGLTAGKILGSLLAGSIAVALVMWIVSVAKARKASFVKNRCLLWILSADSTVILALILLWPTIAVSNIVCQTTQSAGLAASSAVQNASSEISEKVSQGLSLEVVIGNISITGG